MATYDDFNKLDIRVGKIVDVEDFPEARKPSYKLTIDFGPEIGTKRSSAHLVKYYKKEDFPPRQIGPFMSEVLTLGVPDEDKECILIVPDKEGAVIGGKLF